MVEVEKEAEVEAEAEEVANRLENGVGWFRLSQSCFEIMGRIESRRSRRTVSCSFTKQSIFVVPIKIQLAE